MSKIKWEQVSSATEGRFEAVVLQAVGWSAPDRVELIVRVVDTGQVLTRARAARLQWLSEGLRKELDQWGGSEEEKTQVSHAGTDALFAAEDAGLKWGWP